MPIKTVSCREFNQDPSRAKKAAMEGPVFITNRGMPAHVLLSIEEYRRITGLRRNLVDALSMPGLSEIEEEFPRSRKLVRPVDFASCSCSTRMCFPPDCRG